MKTMEKKAKMYKAKHSLILGNKYLPFWQKGLGQKWMRKEEEKKKKKKKRRKGGKKIKGMDYYGFI